MTAIVIMYIDDGEHARDDAGDEQLADVLLGDDAVDGEHRRGRQHGAERAAGRDHAGRRRIADSRSAASPDRRRVENVAAVATDEPEIAAKPPQAAMVAMPSPPRRWPRKRVGGAEQLAAHAGIGDKRAHQQEHRDDAESVVGHRAHGGVADDLQAPASPLTR